MKTCLMAISLLLTAAGAGAQTAAAWNFNGGLAATTTASGISTASIVLGSAIGSGAFNSGIEYFGEGGWPSGALDLNAYLQFSAGPAAGYFFMLNSVTVTTRRSTTGTAAGSGPMNWSLRSSIDGYASDLASGTLTTSYQALTVTLPAAFHTLTGSVSFRVYGYNQVTTTGGNNRFVFDNINLTGSAVSGTLALRSLELRAKAVSGGIGLQWQVQGAPAETRFVLERSTDGTAFTSIGETADSSFMDGTSPSASTLYYRVQAQQPGEAVVYSNIAVVTASSGATASIRAVAAEGSSLQAMLHFADAGACRISIWSRDGKPLYHQELEVQAGDRTVTFSPGAWPHGVYILSIAAGGTSSSKAFIF